MDYYTKTGMVAMPKLLAGDYIVNLGEILEIEEKETIFWVVIERMQERQVWRFLKDESLLVFKPFVDIDIAV